jgi:hypothetical protein
VLLRGCAQAYTPEEWLQSIPKITRYFLMTMLAGLVLTLLGVISINDMVFFWPLIKDKFQARASGPQCHKNVETPCVSHAHLRCVGAARADLATSHTGVLLRQAGLPVSHVLHAAVQVWRRAGVQSVPVRWWAGVGERR